MFCGLAENRITWFSNRVNRDQRREVHGLEGSKLQGSQTVQHRSQVAILGWKGVKLQEFKNQTSKRPLCLATTRNARFYRPPRGPG